jgi:hypothetical protein
MEQFTQIVDGCEFRFHGFLEGTDEVCRVYVDGQNFKMIIGEDGSWKILQQVPSWIKQLEPQLAQAIDKAYC